MDRIRTAGVPILKRFLAGDNEVVLTIRKRGVAPLGGGEVQFKCPISRNLKTIQVLKFFTYVHIFMYMYIYVCTVLLCNNQFFFVSLKIVEW